MVNLYIARRNIKNDTFCVHISFSCLVCTLEQTLTIFPYSIDLLVFINRSVLCAVRIGVTRFSLTPEANGNNDPSLQILQTSKANQIIFWISYYFSQQLKILRAENQNFLLKIFIFLLLGLPCLERPHHSLLPPALLPLCYELGVEI